MGTTVNNQFYGLTQENFKSVGKGLFIAMVGAGLTYLSTFVTNHDFGMYTPIITGLGAVVFNTLWKVLDGVK